MGKNEEINKDDVNNNLISEAEEKFNRNSEIGEQRFFVRTWPAWYLNAQEKWYSPVIRLYVGGKDGELLIEKPVVLTAAIEFISDLIESVAADAGIAAELKGYKMFVPFDKEKIIEDIKYISLNVDRLKEFIETIDISSDIDE